MEQILQELKEEFASLPDSFSRYAYLIELARLLPPVDTTLRQEAYRYHGCQSQVWLRVRVQDESFYLDADSDTLLIRGVLALFREVLNGQPVASVEQADFDLLETLGIGEYFSSVRTGNIARLLPELQRRLQHVLSS